ncbi:MAG: chitobiase/beta-hexosaminidase C-terminal domain-containing protein [Terracidiphilus sp.]
MVTSRFFFGWVISRLHSNVLSLFSLIIFLALIASGTQASAAKVATPTFSPAAGTYTSTQMVSISDSTSGATIYYTTNGSTPTTASAVYSSAITVSETETLKAIGTHSGDTNSSVGSAKYTIKVATPTFSPGAGTYTATQTITISDATSGANIYYTTNGSTPTTASTHYTSPVSVSVSQTLKALATHTGDTNSAVGSAVYTIQVATPTFSPGGGVYSSGQTVTISDTTSGANIYYTTNGTTPTTASTHYTSPVSVSVSQTLEAIATHSGETNSAVGSAVYTIGSGGTPIMTVQHNSGSSEDSDALAVSFTSNVTSGNVILVAESTYDAETLASPTDTIGNTFTLLVTAGTSGDSVVAVYAATNKSSGADTVTCNDNDASNNLHCNIYEVQGINTTVDKTGNNTLTSTSQTVSTSAATSNAVDYVFAFFTDNANGANITGGPGYGDTELSNDGGDSAFSEDSVVVATGVQTATATSNLSDADVTVIVALETTGTATVSTPTFSPSPGTYIYAQSVSISDWTSGSTIYYTTNGTTPTTNSTKYTAPFNVSVTQTVEALAVASGFANSAVASATYTITPPAATPGFSPAAGSYSSAQNVTISDATSGATIYYTTNGYTPTTNSSVYSSAINVSVWETLQAVAIASGYSLSPVGVATYTIGNAEAAAPSFSPGPGDYDSAQTVTLSDGTSGATIYYTTNGSTPTTNSTRYTAAISVTATETIEAIATASGYTQSGVASGVYTINTATGRCDGMSLGTSVAGTADMNGFVPFQNATSGLVSQWNTNIANAAVDPNNAAIQTTAGFAGESTHVNFGSSPGDGGIPFMIVDSGTTPKVALNIIDYANNSDVVVAPYPNNVPIEGDFADCSGWPDTYQSDAHTNVLDRNTCWDYETFNTNRCNGLYDASEETIWDMANGNYRPWGWTSTDAAGLSVMAGLLKYDEANSGTIKHAIRYTMQQSKNDANGGYFVEPASHAAGTTYGAPVVEGMRIRLNSTFNISGYSAINQAILTAFQQYGLIMADNGGYLYIQGATDSRWNDSDLVNLAGIPSSDFTVVQMTPSYPGYDSVTAPTGSAPTISSFSVSDQTVSAGTPVTFTYSVSGDSYDYIDMIGPVKAGGGSITISPIATQTYTLYSVNQYGDNGVGEGYGVTTSTPITVVVPGSVVAAPTFTPVAGTYSAATAVTFNTTTYPYATFYYTTDGSTPTYPPTGTTMEYPVIPPPMSSQDTGALADITVSTSSTIKAIAVAPGYSSPSAVSSAAYTIN